MIANFNYNKMRCKKLHWMTETTVWSWWLIFVDAHSELQPKHKVAAGDCIAEKSNLMGGKFEEDSEPNGPN
tara:strand:+ start:1937 stop:2149 length:213 start_codon:yes stop_codon:yes gene_type:complete